MSVYIFALGIKAANGLVKSTINTANAFVESGTNVCIVNILGSKGGFDFLDPAFSLDERVSRISLDAISEKIATAEQKKTDFYVENQQFLKAYYHEGHKKSLQLINSQLTENDLVIFSHPLALVIFNKANPKTRAKTIIQVHGNYIEEVDNLNLLRDYVDAVDYIQTVSLYMRGDLIEILGTKESKVKCIYNITKPLNIARKPSGMTKRISIIGSIQKRKNQLDAIRMLSLIEDRNVVLQIFGKPLKQEYMNLLNSYIDLYGLKDRVIFQGLASEKEIYENTDVAIMPSEHEGFGYIFLEGACYGIPIVAYDFKYGAKEFTCDNQNGCLIEMGNYQQMAKVVNKLLTDADEYQQVVEFNKNNFAEKYAEHLVLQSYHDLFDNINHSVALNFAIAEQTQSFKVENLTCNSIKLPTKQPWTEAIIEEGFYKVAFEIDSHPDDLRFFYTYKKSKFPIKANFDKVAVEIDSTSALFLKSYKKTKTQLERYQVSLLIPKVNRLSFGEDIATFSISADMNGVSTIIANINNGDIQCKPVESIATLTKDCLGSKKIQNVLNLLRPDGFYIQYPSFDSIKMIKNEEGERFDFSTHVLKFYGKETLFFKLKQGLYKKLIIVTNSDEELSIDFSEYSYKSVFNKILELEKKYSLYDIRIQNIYAWELIRASLFEHILEALGVLDKHFGQPRVINNKYFGNKNMSNSTLKDKLIFEFPRKGLIDHKTLAVQQSFLDESVVLEYPQSYGYSDRSYDEGSSVYPILDFLEAIKKQPTFEFSGNDKQIIRWFKQLFINEFGLDIEFSLFFKNRITKFLSEFNYFDNYFKNHRFKEILIPSAYWSAGIIAAAKKRGVIASDIQYALISKYHPSFAFPVTARAYGSDRVYLWSKYWNIKETPYNKSIVLNGNYLSEKIKSLDVNNSDNCTYDVAFVSQSRIGRKLFNFALEYAKQNPNQSIVICPHPDECFENYAKFSELVDVVNISISNQDTLSIIASSRNVVGVYSTSLVEAAAIGKAVYSLSSISGHEVLEREVAKGFIKYVDSIDSLSTAVNKEFSMANAGEILYGLGV